MDYAPLIQVADQVLDGDRKLDMHDYTFDLDLAENESKEAEDFMCKTSACIAGWLLINAGIVKPVMQRYGLGTGAVHVTWTTPPHGYLRDAAVVLGVKPELDEDQEVIMTGEYAELDHLFHGYQHNNEAALEVLHLIRDEDATLGEAMDRIPVDWEPEDSLA